MKRTKKRGVRSALASLTAMILMLVGCGKSVYAVGKDITRADMTEFWHTRSSSTNPPDYQRYRLFREGDVWYLYHETRAGDHWPLTENDITVSGTVRLTEEETDALLGLLEGGEVRARAEDTTSGSSGPWLYLYWTGDRGTIQEFRFASFAEAADFEKRCETIAARTAS